MTKTDASLTLEKKRKENRKMEDNKQINQSSSEGKKKREQCFKQFDEFTHKITSRI